MEQPGQLFESILDLASAHVAVLDKSGRFVYTNAAWQQFAEQNGYVVRDWMGLNYFDACQAALADGDQYCIQAVQSIQKILSGEHANLTLEYPCHSPDEERWFLMRANPVYLQGELFVCLHHERFIADNQLKNSRRRLSLATEAANIGIWEYNIQTRALIWDQRMFDLYGIPRGDASITFDAWKKTVYTEDLNRALRDVQRAIDSGGPLKSEYRIVRPDREIRTLIAEAQVFNDGQGCPAQVIGINMDISDRKKSEEKVRKLAYFDPLTLLPNRSLIEDRLQQALSASARTKLFGALLFLDLDNFKIINDTAGHGVGDELLQQVARRIQSCIRGEDSLARLGGDEFIILLVNLAEKEDRAALQAKTIAQKISTVLNEPFPLSSGIQHSSGSIGITLFNDDACSLSDIMRQADLAMYKAKGMGRNTLYFYDAGMQLAISKKTGLQRDLIKSFSNNELHVRFQPQFDQDQNIVGAEALVRWDHPERGYLEASEFVPIAEETGLIMKLGDWVLEKCCERLSLWESLNLPEDFYISVNLSSLQVQQRNFSDNFKAILQRRDISPKRIKIELTESALVKDIDATSTKMRNLKSSGASFSLDDFGTGLSSLSSLKRLPIDQLKIDQSFVRDILTDPNDKAIAKTIIALASILELDVIAEGVENAEQFTMLKDLGCHYFQGFFFSHPVSAEQLIQKVSIVG